jgi:type VI secretion system protein ImpC
MVESIQHVLTRVRPPRVVITYDVEIGGAIEKKELPFVVGVIADLAGKTQKALPPVKKRRFVEISRDNFDDVLASLEPRIAFNVIKTLGASHAAPKESEAASGKPAPEKGDAGKGKEGVGEKASSSAPSPSQEMGVDIVFTCMDDFGPINVVKKIPLLNTAYEKRVALNDLVGHIDGNTALDDALVNLFSDKGTLGKILAEAKANDPGKPAPETDKLLQTGNVVSNSPEETARLRQLIFNFAEEIQAVGGEIKANDSYFFIMQRITFWDKELSTQLDQILHHSDFQKLEGAWRGLHYLVMNTETGPQLKIRFMQIGWTELVNDLERAVEFDQSQMFKKIYEEEYGTFGGHPYACLVVDFPFNNNYQEVNVLTKMTQVAAAAHAPALAQASPQLFNMQSFTEMGAPRSLANIFDSTAFASWSSFRSNPDSRYMSLMLPRVLMRMPYGRNTWPVDEFDYEEAVDGEDNSKFCWGNPAYAMATRITHAFSLYSWTAAIRGVEGGGLVEGLPAYTFKTKNGDLELKCPTEVIITDRREKELSDLGFLALCHCKGTDYAAFFGGQTAQKPKKYNTDEANANALVSTRLPYILNCSRFAHYIKSIMRDKIGSFMSKADVELYLQNWLADYVLLSDTASQEAKAKYPLREGRVVVTDVPGKPGSYKAVLFLRPHFQLEELTVSLRLVARLPQPAS